MTVSEKIKTLGWFLARPELYPELARRIRSRRFTNADRRRLAEQERAEGREWAEAHESAAAALLETLGLPSALESPSVLEPQDWAAAVEADARCSSGMGGPAHVDLLFTLARGIKVTRAIETGVARGWSSLAILLALRSSQASAEGRLISIDMPYPKLGAEDQVGLVVGQALRHRWRLIRRADRDGLPPALAELGTIDLAHHDSDKSVEGRLFVYRTVWAHIRPGGILLSDDIEDNLAFRDFATSVERRPWVVRKSDARGFVGVLVK